MPTPCLVDLLHPLNGVLVEQFEKGVENLLKDLIFHMRLLKLHFKILPLSNPEQFSDRKR